MDVAFNHRARGTVDIVDGAGGIVGSMVWTGSAWEVWSHIQPSGGPLQKVAQTSYNQQVARGVALEHFSRL